VAIVGGGPGAADLITVRGLRLLQSADVVVVDRLAPRQLLDDLGPDVEIVDVGKTGYGPAEDQAVIERLLVDRARRGLFVVRLKGGDPFVFGRGAEEVAACRAAGVEVDVVPGVTSAVAAPGAAGIPVTSRGVSATLVVVAAQGAADNGSQVDWASLARIKATLVVLMGARRVGAIARTLIEHGASPPTPAAVVERATVAGERTYITTLGGIEDLAAAQALRAPAVLVVGDVVRLGAAAVTSACAGISADT